MNREIWSDERIVRLLRTTTIERLVTGRSSDSPACTYTEKRLLHPIDFPKDRDMEFVFTQHIFNPNFPLGRYYCSIGDIDEAVIYSLALKMAQASFLKDTQLLIPVPNGGKKYAQALSEITSIPVCPILLKVGSSMEKGMEIIDSLRKQVKYKRVTLVEDTTTKSYTITNYCYPLLNGLTEMLGVVTAHEREEGGRERLNNFNLDLYSGSTKTEWFDLMLSLNDPNILTQDQYNFVMEKVYV